MRQPRTLILCLATSGGKYRAKASAISVYRAGCPGLVVFTTATGRGEKTGMFRATARTSAVGPSVLPGGR